MKNHKRPRVRFVLTGTCIRCKKSAQLNATQLKEEEDFKAPISVCCQMPLEIEKKKVPVY